MILVMLYLDISKQTENINEMVLGEKRCKNKVIKYIPHGLDNKIFKPINKFDKEYQKLQNSLKEMVKWNLNYYLILEILDVNVFLILY